MQGFIVAFIVLFSGLASADEVARGCYAKAQKSVNDISPKGYYDRDGITAYTCEVANNNAVVICDVSASKGDGAATDTFRVVMNKPCTRTYRVEMIGEE